FLAHVGNAALVAVERGFGRFLRNGGSTGGGLGLHLGHGFDDMFRAGSETDAPAGHGVGLGYAVHDHGAVFEFRRRVDDIHERLVGPQDVFVHVVGGDENVRVLGDDGA